MVNCVGEHGDLCLLSLVVSSSYALADPIDCSLLCCKARWPQACRARYSCIPVGRLRVVLGVLSCLVLRRVRCSWCAVCVCVCACVCVCVCAVCECVCVVCVTVCVMLRYSLRYGFGSPTRSSEIAHSTGLSPGGARAYGYTGSGCAQRNLFL